jgi:hypothetical protein
MYKFTYSNSKKYNYITVEKNLKKNYVKIANAPLHVRFTPAHFSLVHIFVGKLVLLRVHNHTSISRRAANMIQLLELVSVYVLRGLHVRLIVIETTGKMLSLQPSTVPAVGIAAQVLQVQLALRRTTTRRRRTEGSLLHHLVIE